MTEQEYRNEKFAARRLLRSYQGRNASIDNLADAIRILELEAATIKSATTDSTPVQGGGNGREERLNANIDRRDELKNRLERAKRTVQIVNRALDTLTPDEQHILEVMHIYRQRGATERLRREFNYEDKSAVHKRENRALEHFALAAFAAERNDPLELIRQLFGNKTGKN